MFRCYFCICLVLTKSPSFKQYTDHSPADNHKQCKRWLSLVPVSALVNCQNLPLNIPPYILLMLLSWALTMCPFLLPRVVLFDLTSLVFSGLYFLTRVLAFIVQSKKMPSVLKATRRKSLFNYRCCNQCCLLCLPQLNTRLCLLWRALSSS